MSAQPRLEDLLDEEDDFTPVEPPKKKRKTKRDAWRRFWGTINNPTDEETKVLKTYLETDAYKEHKISAIILQSERGEDTGTFHYQMYCELTQGVQLSSRQIHKIPGFARMALKTPPRQTRKAVEYCNKQKTKVPGLKGHRGTFRGYKDQPSNEEIFQKIKNQEISMREISNSNPMLFLRSHAGLQKMIGLNQTHRCEIPTIKFYVGPTGCGKSLKAYADHPGAYNFTWPNKGTMWFDAYEGGNPQGVRHDTIIFDELTSSRIGMTVLMDMLSSKPYPVQYKGGFTTMNSHTLVFTTNEEPMDLYPRVPAKAFSMLKRRILQFAEIYDFTRPDGPHWLTDYQGPKVAKDQFLREIICQRRTDKKERTVGLEDTDFRQIRNEQNHNLYQGSGNRITGHKRKRDQGSPGSDCANNPYGNYGR